jgi:hypothetical protein
MPGLNRPTQQLVALGALIAPTLHTATDVMEWLQGGFSLLHLWVNYFAFLPVPAVILGLYAVQRPAIPLVGLIGALLYGFSFVYFSHTTLLALALHVPTYEALWTFLGVTYTIHGVVMIVGGGCFGWATLRTGVLPRWTAALFLAGLGLNLLFGLLPVPDLIQTIGTAIRNCGLVGMGWTLARRSVSPLAVA